MSRKTYTCVVNKCEECPAFAYTFDNKGLSPFCTLAHKIVQGTPNIPAWCPLPEEKPEEEKP